MTSARALLSLAAVKSCVVVYLRGMLCVHHFPGDCDASRSPLVKAETRSVEVSRRRYGDRRSAPSWKNPEGFFLPLLANPPGASRAGARARTRVSRVRVRVSATKRRCGERAGREFSKEGEGRSPSFVPSLPFPGVIQVYFAVSDRSDWVTVALISYTGEASSPSPVRFVQLSILVNITARDTIQFFSICFNVFTLDRL